MVCPRGFDCVVYLLLGSWTIGGALFFLYHDFNLNGEGQLRTGYISKLDLHWGQGINDSCYCQLYMSTYYLPIDHRGCQLTIFQGLGDARDGTIQGGV